MMIFILSIIVDWALNSQKRFFLSVIFYVEKQGLQFIFHILYFKSRGQLFIFSFIRVRAINLLLMPSVSELNAHH
jgi:hypothetical protein